jgi:hypothetical protein
MLPHRRNLYRINALRTIFLRPVKILPKRLAGFAWSAGFGRFAQNATTQHTTADGNEPAKSEPCATSIRSRHLIPRPNRTHQRPPGRSNRRFRLEPECTIMNGGGPATRLKEPYDRRDGSCTWRGRRQFSRRVHVGSRHRGTPSIEHRGGWMLHCSDAWLQPKASRDRLLDRWPAKQYQSADLRRPVQRLFFRLTCPTSVNGTSIAAGPQAFVFCDIMAAG